MNLPLVILSFLLIRSFFVCVCHGYPVAFGSQLRTTPGAGHPLSNHKMWSPATAFTESEACFDGLLKDLNLTRKKELLNNSGFRTIADFAHCVEINPLNVDNKRFSEEVLWKLFEINSADEEPEDGNQFRKLFFKCS